MRIAMLGTRGVPARYGGFETAIEEVGRRLARVGHEVTVYCRNQGQNQTEHLGMHLVNLPAVRRRSLETLSHTALSVGHCAVHRPDVAAVFNAGNAPLLPVLRVLGIPTTIHIDGLEWKRAKWKGFGARYYRWSERVAVRTGDAVVADAVGIRDYVSKTYGRGSRLIAYGAPVIRPGSDRLGELDLQRDGYHLVVARLEPENFVHLILEGYAQSQARLPLVVVGSAPYQDEYIASLHARATGNVRFLGSIWDQQLLDQLYANCRSYLHGHSVGGTNPSLLRALGAGAPTTAYDVVFNREVTGGNAQFFRDARDVAEAVRVDDAAGEKARSRGESGRYYVAEQYRWDEVAAKYEQMFADLCGGKCLLSQATSEPRAVPSPRPSVVGSVRTDASGDVVDLTQPSSASSDTNRQAAR